MLLIPAIDLKDGQCVRLQQGDMNRVTTFNTDPVAQAGKPVSFTGTTTIDRREYGMKSYQLIVGNKVDITLKARMVPR